MRIVFATMQYGRGYSQGTERYLSMLAEGLRARGHEPLVLAGDPERRGRQQRLGEALPNEPTVHACPTDGWLAVRGVSPRHLRPTLARLRPEVVHIGNPAHIGVGVFEAARSLGIPTVFTIVDYWWICPTHTLQLPAGGVCDGRVTWTDCVRCLNCNHRRPSVRWLARGRARSTWVLAPVFLGHWLRKGAGPAELWRWTRRQRILAGVLGAAEAVIFPSRTALDRLAGRVPAERAHVVPNGLEPHWFKPPRPAQEPISRGLAPGTALAPESLVIGMAGALVAHKGAHVLLEAMRQLGWSRTRIQIAGGGDAPDYEQHLRKLSSGLRVEFLGSLAPADMPRFLAGLDVLVIPSTWLENHPIIALEAAAQRLPTLASGIGGLAEMMDRRSLFAPGDAAALAARLSAWVAGDRAAAPPPVATADEMVERTIEIYRRVAPTAR